MSEISLVFESKGSLQLEAPCHRRHSLPSWGEYSCRCHGKRVISAPSKPLKLKLAGHILYGETRLRTKGFCSAPLRSRDIRDKVRNGILTLFRDQLYFSTTKQRRTKSFGTHVHNTSNNTSTKLQLQLIKLHIEIINLKPVTPTTILLPLAAPHRPSAFTPRPPCPWPPCLSLPITICTSVTPFYTYPPALRACPF